MTRYQLTPNEAIRCLIAANWSQVAIANKTDSTKANIWQILHRGTTPSYKLGLDIIKLAYKHGKLSAVTEPKT